MKACGDEKISTPLIQACYRSIKNPQPLSTFVLDCNAPFNIVEAVTSFFNGSITVDPLWNPSSFTNPTQKIDSPLASSWCSSTSLNCTCFLSLFCDSNVAEPYFIKLKGELEKGNFQFLHRSCHRSRYSCEV